MNQIKLKTKPRTEVLTVSPDMAKSWLSSVTIFQRCLSQKKIAQYAAAMGRGEWKITPTHSIGISSNNEIVDGQHRLSAVVKYGRPVKMSIVFNCPVDIFAVIDQGYKRNLSQIASMAGSKMNSSWHIAALNSLNWRHDTLCKISWSSDDCLYLLEKYHQALEFAFPKRYSGHNQCRMSGFRGAALRAIICYPDRAEDISDFVKVVAEGLPLEDGRVFTTALMLRNIIFSINKKNGGGGTIGRHNIYRASLIALKKFIEGKKVNYKSTLIRSSIKKQPFPIDLDKKPIYQSAELFFKLLERQKVA